MKRLLCLLCAVSFFTLPALAVSPEDAYSPARKQAWRTQAREVWQAPDQPLTVDEEIERITACEKQGLSYAKKRARLRRDGIFQLAPPSEEPTLATSADGLSVSLAPPGLYYAAGSDSWYLTMMGVWSPDDPWSYVLPRAGDVGWYDAFGLSYTAPSGDLPARLGARGWMDDGAANGKVTTAVSAASLGYGVGFELQDYRDRKGGRYVSVGRRFGGIIQYPAEFADFSCGLTAFYAHTGPGCWISRLKFTGAASGSGLKVAFDKPAAAFLVYTGAPVTFSVQHYPAWQSTPVIAGLAIGLVTGISCVFFVLLRKIRPRK